MVVRYAVFLSKVFFHENLVADLDVIMLQKRSLRSIRVQREGVDCYCSTRMQRGILALRGYAPLKSVTMAKKLFIICIKKAVEGWRVYGATARSDLEDRESFFCECRSSYRVEPEIGGQPLSGLVPS